MNNFVETPHPHPHPPITARLCRIEIYGVTFIVRGNIHVNRIKGFQVVIITKYENGTSLTK